MTRILNEAAVTGWLANDVNSYYTSLSVQSDLILDPKHLLWTHTLPHNAFLS